MVSFNNSKNRPNDSMRKMKTRSDDLLGVWSFKDSNVHVHVNQVKVYSSTEGNEFTTWLS